jgi:hypothetical protein
MAVQNGQPNLNSLLIVLRRDFDSNEGCYNKSNVILINTFFFRPDKLSRLTVIPGWMKIKIQPITELPESKLENILNLSVP